MVQLMKYVHHTDVYKRQAMHAHDFEKAVDVADSLDIKKIRDNNLLSLIADAYELTGDNEQAKKILLMRCV